MISVTFAMPHPLTSFVINNFYGTVQRIEPDCSSLPVSEMSNEIPRIIEEMESQSITTTLLINKSQQINELLKIKDIYIQQRNRIVDSLFKRFIPFYRHKLQNIDSEIDKLDLFLYQLEMENKITESKIDEMIDSAEERLKKQSKFLEQALKNKQTDSMRPNL